MLIKLSSEQITQLGGLKDPSEFSARFAELCEKAEAPKTEQKVISIADVQALCGEQMKTFTASIGAVEATVKTIQAEVAKVDVDALVKKAEDAGSKAAAKSLGKVGANGAGAADLNPNDGTGDKPKAEALNSEGKFEEAWAASEDLKKEFPSAKCYAAFAKAESEGRVTINKPTK